MQNAVFYFSGTGNSFYVARLAAAALGCRPTEIGRAAGERISCDKALIVFPSYAYGAPKPVLKFLKNLPFTARYLAVAVTCGSTPGGTLQSVRRVLKRRRVFPALYAELGAPENFLPIFGTMENGKLDSRLDLLRQMSERLVQDIAEERTNDVRGLKPLSAIVSNLFLTFSPVVALFSHVKAKKCSGCRRCEKHCPAHAIEIKKSGKARIVKSKCAICQRCLNICPEKCIVFWRVTPKSGRYFHPEVKLKEMSENKTDNITK